MNRPYRPKLSVALGFIVILSTLASASLSATVVQAAATRTFYIDLQRRLETGLQAIRTGRPLPPGDVRYARWNTPVPQSGRLQLSAPPALTGSPAWFLSAREVTRLRQGQALFATEGPPDRPIRALIAPTVGGMLETTYTSSDEVNALLRTLRDMQILAVMTVTLLTMIAATFAIQRLFVPLRTITTALGRLNPRAPGPPQELPPIAGEFEDLATAFNAMVRRTTRVLDAQENFVRDAGHELRTPITSISGHAAYMLRRTNPTEQQRESLGIIVKEAERMTRLIGDLQTLTRATNTAGGTTFALRPLLDDVYTSLRTSVLETVTVRIDGPDVWIHGVRDQFVQVMVNLLSNAAQAGAKTITVTIQPTSRTVQVQVQDDGGGIPPEAREHVFERFFRTSDARDRRAGGSGLGLSITQRIVQAHGGDITVDSQIGVGTVFTLTLPVASEQDAPPATPPRAS